MPDLVRGTLARLVQASSTLSSRGARAAARDAGYWHSRVRFLIGAEPEADLTRLELELVETLRDVGSLDLGPGVGTDPDIARLRAELAAVRSRIGDLLAVGAPAGSSVAEQVAALSGERDAIERRLRVRLVEEGDFTGSIRVLDVARGLPEGAVAIGYFHTEGWRLEQGTGRVVSVGNVLGAHVVSAAGSVAAVELGRVEELAALALRWRAALGAALPGTAPETAPIDEGAAGRALRERILDPLLDGLDEDTRTLFVCAADFVHAVPLEALPLGAGVVGDRLSVVRGVSMRPLVAPLKPPAGGGGPELLAVGAVDFGAEPPAAEANARSGRARSFPALPGSAQEVAAVRTLFEGAFGREPSLLLEAAATKVAFRDRASGMRYLHVATHGWFEEVDFPERPAASELWTPLPPERTVARFAPLSLCGLALAGANRGRDPIGRVPGILTAEELAALDLSACETNVGLRSAGLGIQSLQAALHAAGVRTAVTSLWKVPDRTTSRLMERFYSHLWVEGMPAAEALWRAKCELRDAGYAKRDWAAWVLSGGQVR